MARPRLVVVNAQSQNPQAPQSETPSFSERRSRPRHGTIKLIEDAVYRALREQGRQAPAHVPTFAPRTVSGPPTMVLYSAPGADLVAMPELQDEVAAAAAAPELREGLMAAVLGSNAFRLATGKIFQLLKSKQSYLSLLKPAA